MQRGFGHSGPAACGPGFDNHSLARCPWWGCKNFFSIGGDEMNAVKIAGIVLIVAGVLGLVYGSFSYTKETHEAKLGPIELSVKDKETVNVPVWAGVGAIVIGGVLLIFGSKKS
jgi:drug/metabolite transporter (DMT)-like permease